LRSDCDVAAAFTNTTSAGRSSHLSVMFSRIKFVSVYFITACMSIAHMYRVNQNLSIIKMYHFVQSYMPYQPITKGFLVILSRISD